MHSQAQPHERLRVRAVLVGCQGRAEKICIYSLGWESFGNILESDGGQRGVPLGAFCNQSVTFFWVRLLHEAHFIMHGGFFIAAPSKKRQEMDCTLLLCYSWW